VQLTGALSLPDVDESSIELVRDVARMAGGPANWFYAPMILPEPGNARSLRAQTQVARAFERFDALTKAIVSVGAWDRSQSTVADAVSPAEYEELAQLGACAELCGLQLDVEGNPLQTELSQRIVGIGPEQLRSVPEIIATAYGPAKARAVRAVIRGGFVSTLITHRALAQALLRLQ
jgi:DNA-binding transcriptional regulator LsrR (DeoR family)